MAIKHITYLDLTPEQRRQGAGEARTRLQGHLAHPFLTPGQRAQVAEEFARIGAWEHGRIPVAHEVSLSDTVEVAEDVGG
jgi:hypothetical protein